MVTNSLSKNTEQLSFATAKTQPGRSRHKGSEDTLRVGLIVADAHGNCQQLELLLPPDNSRCVFVGRSGSNNISCDDDKMSRHHFCILEEDERFFLDDLGTTNGTFVNGMRVGSHHELDINDVITAGSEKFIFRGLV